MQKRKEKRKKSRLKSIGGEQSEPRKQLKARIVGLEKHLARLGQQCQQNFRILLKNDQTIFEMNQTNSVVGQGTLMAVEELLKTDLEPWMQKALVMLKEKQLARKAQEEAGKLPVEEPALVAEDQQDQETPEMPAPLLPDPAEPPSEQITAEGSPPQ